MNKPDSLCAHLLATVPGLAASPDRLLVFIDEGSIRSTAAPGLSFEYSYTLNIILTDYAAHADAVAIPLLAWLLKNQPELLTNLETGKTAIAYEADILDRTKLDLSFRLPLTERVIVKQLADGNLQVSHPDEPELIEGILQVNGQRLVTTTDEVIAQWGTLP